MTAPQNDPKNTTYTTRFESLFTATGDLVPFQKNKYIPSIERMRRAGLQSGDRVLDVGVGYGAFLRLLEREGFGDVHGMDPFEGSIDIASKAAPTAKISHGRIEDDPWPFEDGFFDALTSFDVIEHLETPSIFFEHASRYVRPGGLILATTPLKQIGYRLRSAPWIGKPDLNPTHINVHPPEYWLKLAGQSPLRLIEAWRGENLTHIKYIHLIGRALSVLGIDHRNVPLLRRFEQSYLMLFRRP